MNALLAHLMSWAAIIVVLAAIVGGVVVGIVFGVRKAARRAKNGAPDWYVEYDQQYYRCDFNTVRAMKADPKQTKQFFLMKQQKMGELYKDYEDLLKSELKYCSDRKKWVSIATLMASVKSTCPICGGRLVQTRQGVMSHGGHMSEIMEETVEDTGLVLEAENGQKINVKRKVQTPKQVLVGATYDEWSTTNFDCTKCKKTIIAEKTFNVTDDDEYEQQVYRKFLVPWYTSELRKELPEELFNYIDRPHDEMFSY